MNARYSVLPERLRLRIPSGVREPIHIPALDGFRGLAIILVLLAHLRDLTGSYANDPMLYRLFFYGNIGVDMFFVLSGFLITRALLVTRNKEHYLRNFYTRRALRIMPIYYAFLFFCLVLIPILWGPAVADHLCGRPFDRMWLWIYGTNIVLAIKNAQVMQALNPLWSLAVEEQFYLVWPFLILMVRDSKLLARICVYLAVAAPIFRVIVILSGSTLGSYTLTPCRIDGLALGALIAVLEQQANYKRTEMRLPPLMVVSSVVLLGVIAHFNFQGSLFYSGVGVTAALLLVATIKFSQLKRFFESGCLRFFGRYSYGIYLYHLFVFYLVKEHAQALLHLTHIRALDLFIFDVVCTTAAVCVAFLSYHLFEKQFLKLKDVLTAKPATDHTDDSGDEEKPESKRRKRIHIKTTTVDIKPLIGPLTQEQIANGTPVVGHDGQNVVSRQVSVFPVMSLSAPAGR